jgi:hypothetical protein
VICIPREQIKRLNATAVKHVKTSLSSDCPALKGGHNLPVLLALPSMDSVGWVRCIVPVSSGCGTHVHLGIVIAILESCPRCRVSKPVDSL